MKSKGSKGNGHHFFLCGFGMETQATGINPKAKEIPPAETSKPVMTRSKIFVKLKPRKQVKEQVSKASVVILETPQPTKQKIVEVK